MKRALAVASLVAATLAVAGCQSASVAHFEKHHDLGTSSAVVVEPFSMSQCEFIGDHGEHTAAEVQSALQTSLVRRLRERGLTARTSAEGPAAAGETVVRGDIVKCDAGSGAARYFVGLYGGGQSKLVCNARLFDGAVADVPAYELRIEGGSKGQGGIFGASYRTLADADDAAEQVVTFLVEHRTAGAP